MTDTADLLFNLADACQAEADHLQDIARSQNFSEPANSQLGRNEMKLRLISSSLRSSAASVELDDSQSAQTKLKDATEKAKDAATKINDVQNAIKVAGLILSLAASAITGDVPSIIASANALLQGVGLLLPGC